MSYFANEFATRNDTIFGKTNYRTPKYYILPYFFIPRNNAVVRYVIPGCVTRKLRATIHEMKITVPAGTFKPYISFVEDGWIKKDSLVIVPGIGVVCRVTEGRAYPGIPAFTTKWFLKSYKVLN